MPLSESYATANGRWRRFAIWQLPISLFSLITFLALLATSPQALSNSHALAGFLLIAAATIAAAAVPWERVAPRTEIVVPLVDMVAVAWIRYGGYEFVASIGALAIVPILWLAFDFGRWGVTGAVSGACLVTTYPYVLNADLPSSGTAWLQALMLPIASVAIAVVAQAVATVVRRQHHELVEKSRALADALSLAEDRALLGRGIIQSVDAGVAYFDASGHLQLSNEQAVAFAAKAGIRPGSGDPGGHLVWDRDQVTPVAPQDQPLAMALRGEHVADRVQWLGRPGEQIAVVTSAHSLRRPDGEDLGTVVCGWEVTALMDAVRIRDDFLATVSHELRTPLTSIVGYLELVEDALGSTPGRESQAPPPIRPNMSPDTTSEVEAALHIIKRNAHTLLDRIGQLLNASATRSRPLEVTTVNIADVAAAVASKHQPAATAAPIDLSCTGPDLQVDTDQERLEQILDNLVSNAIKYTPAGGTVTITWEPSENGAVISVADTGIGMTPDEARQAFDRFFRSDSAQRSATQGIGLGLSITKNMIEAMGGHIDLTSRPGIGTTVTATVPDARLKPSHA